MLQRQTYVVICVRAICDISVKMVILLCFVILFLGSQGSEEVNQSEMSFWSLLKEYHELRLPWTEAGAWPNGSEPPPTREVAVQCAEAAAEAAAEAEAETDDVAVRLVAEMTAPSHVAVRCTRGCDHVRRPCHLYLPPPGPATLICYVLLPECMVYGHTTVDCEVYSRNRRPESTEFTQVVCTVEYHASASICEALARAGRAGGRSEKRLRLALDPLGHWHSALEEQEDKEGQPTKEEDEEEKKVEKEKVEEEEEKVEEKKKKEKWWDLLLSALAMWLGLMVVDFLVRVRRPRWRRRRRSRSRSRSPRRRRSRSRSRSPRRRAALRPRASRPVVFVVMNDPPPSPILLPSPPASPPRARRPIALPYLEGSTPRKDGGGRTRTETEDERVESARLETVGAFGDGKYKLSQVLRRVKDCEVRNADEEEEYSRSQMVGAFGDGKSKPSKILRRVKESEVRNANEEEQNALITASGRTRASGVWTKTENEQEKSARLETVGAFGDGKCKPSQILRRVKDCEVRNADEEEESARSEVVGAFGDGKSKPSKILRRVKEGEVRNANEEEEYSRSETVGAFGDGKSKPSKILRKVKKSEVRNVIEKEEYSRSETVEALGDDKSKLSQVLDEELVLPSRDADLESEVTHSKFQICKFRRECDQSEESSGRKSKSKCEIPPSGDDASGAADEPFQDVAVAKSADSLANPVPCVRSSREEGIVSVQLNADATPFFCPSPLLAMPLQTTLNGDPFLPDPVALDDGPYEDEGEVSSEFVEGNPRDEWAKFQRPGEVQYYDNANIVDDCWRSRAEGRGEISEQRSAGTCAEEMPWGQRRRRFHRGGRFPPAQQWPFDPSTPAVPWQPPTNPSGLYRPRPTHPVPHYDYSYANDQFLTKTGGSWNNQFHANRFLTKQCFANPLVANQVLYPQIPIGGDGISTTFYAPDQCSCCFYPFPTQVQDAGQQPVPQMGTNHPGWVYYPNGLQYSYSEEQTAPMNHRGSRPSEEKYFQQSFQYPANPFVQNSGYYFNGEYYPAPIAVQPAIPVHPQFYVQNPIIADAPYDNPPTSVVTQEETQQDYCSSYGGVHPYQDPTIMEIPMGTQTGPYPAVGENQVFYSTISDYESGFNSDTTCDLTATDSSREDNPLVKCDEPPMAAEFCFWQPELCDTEEDSNSGGISSPDPTESRFPAEYEEGVTTAAVQTQAPETTAPPACCCPGGGDAVPGAVPGAGSGAEGRRPKRRGAGAEMGAGDYAPTLQPWQADPAPQHYYCYDCARMGYCDICRESYGEAAAPQSFDR